MSAVLWVTTDCNLACKYCYEGNSKPKLVMSKDIVDKAIKFIACSFKDINEKQITIPIHGGEPFLEYETIKYIVKRCKEEFSNKDILFPLTTNGTILNDEILEFIINDIPDITMSIDGASSTHNKMRTFKNGNDTHKIVLENGKKLLSYLPNMRVRMTFDSESVGNLYEDIKFLIDEGFKYIVPAPNLFDKRWNETHIQLLESQMIKAKQYIANLNDVYISIIDKNLYTIKGPCSGGVSNFNIYPNGDIYPCMLTVGNSEFCIGNINTEIYIDKRDELLRHSRCENNECIGCGLVNYCSGSRCKMINKLITNDYYSPPPMQCAMERLKYKINFNQY